MPLDSICWRGDVISPLSRPSADLSPAHTASSAWRSKHEAMWALKLPVT
jgi:hypothetical protein